MARHYETMFIIDPDKTDEEVPEIIEKYKAIVTERGGVISEAGLWEKGRRQLAYPIRKKREGIYVLMQFESDATAPKELERIFGISDEIMRHLVIRTDDDEE